nr:protein Jade-3-like [Symphalangus syndactylus]
MGTGCSRMKRHRPVSSSDSSDESPSTSFTSGSMYRIKSKIPNEHKKPAEMRMQQEGPHQTPDAGALILDFPASRTVTDTEMLLPPAEVLNQPCLPLLARPLGAEEGQA